MSNQVQNNGPEGMIDPKELALAFENTMHVVKGNHDALPALMGTAGSLLVKMSSRLSTTQLVLLVGALTLGAVFLVKRAEDAFDGDDNNNANRGGGQKALSGGGTQAKSGANSDGQKKSSAKGTSAGADKE